MYINIRSKRLEASYSLFSLRRRHLELPFHSLKQKKYKRNQLVSIAGDILRHKKPFSHMGNWRVDCRGIFMDDIWFSATDSAISFLTKLAMTWPVEILRRDITYTLFINRRYSFHCENVYPNIKKNIFSIPRPDLICF